MGNRNAWCVVGIVCLGVALPSHAKTLQTVAGSLDLPFEYHLKERSESSGNSGSGLSFRQNMTLIVDSGPMKDKEVRVALNYFAPSNLGTSSLQSLIQKQSEDLAAKPGTSSMVPLQLDGFGFTVLTSDPEPDDEAKEDVAKDDAAADGTPAAPKKEIVRTTSMRGAINNAGVALLVDWPASAKIEADMTQAMRGFKLDFPSILKVRARYEAAERAAVSGKKMITPTGDYSSSGDLTPSLTSVYTRFDGTGKPVVAKNTYFFSKTGFWTVQRMAFSSMCSLIGGTDEKQLTEWRTVPKTSKKVTVSAIHPPAAINLSGLDATSIEFKRTFSGAYANITTETRRWIARDGDRSYMLEFERVNGGGLEKSLVSQINARPLTCTPRAILVIDSAPAGPAAPAPGGK